jgi:diketogulonate reductase-like aldo/keto reductase
MSLKQLSNYHTKISKIGLGTGIGNYKKNTKYSNNLFKDYINLCLKYNIRLIDTSPVYGNGKSEELIGKYTKSNRSKFFIATKLMPEMCEKKKVKISVLNSLKRLKTSFVDLLQIHWPNEKVPFEETIKAMIKLKKEGLINNIGLCNFSLKQIKYICKKFKAGTIASVQVEYNLFERSIENELLSYCKKNNIAVIAYSPLAQGKFANGTKQLKLLHKISKKYKCSIPQIILAWMCAKDNIFTIPNSSSLENLEKNFQSNQISLNNKDLRNIDKVCKTKIKNIDSRKIIVSNNYNRKVYANLLEAVENKMNMTPSPVELSKEIKKGNFLKPIRLKKIKKEGKIFYDLTEGRLRYWSWVIAFGWNKSIPALVWEN